MKLAFCPLVSRDIQKSIRATNTCRDQFPADGIDFETVAIINSKNSDFIREFSEWCEKENIKYKITESNGSPAKGKNAVLEFLRDSDYDAVSMTDGDDLVYPTAAKQISRHLNHHQGTDVIIVKPSDQVCDYKYSDNCNEFKNGLYAYCWGMNIVKLGYEYGPNQHDIFTVGHKAARNLGGHIFYSKKASNLLKYDEEQLLGEDLLIEFQMLRLHQEGRLSFWLSFASDIQMLDRTYQDSIQYTKNGSDGEFYFNRLKSEVIEIVPQHRSSFQELPVEFPELMFSYEQKIEWLKKVF